MDDILTVTSHTSARAVEMYEVLQPQVDALVADERFRSAMDQLDVAALQSGFRDLDRGITEYNKFHLEERRLWRTILRNGGKSPGVDQQEAEFKKKVPHGRESYRQTFTTAGAMAGALADAGFDGVLREHLHGFTATLATPSHPYADAVFGYFRGAGCSESMLDEFTTSFKKVNFDFFAAAGGGIDAVRKMSARGVEAEVEILDYTEAHGFSYLRGRCGPPQWAIVASQILAAAGISISAWVIVAIIVGLLATLALICALSAPGSWLRDKCRLLNFLLPIFRF
jgi:hypothetical protein